MLYIHAILKVTLIFSFSSRSFPMSRRLLEQQDRKNINMKKNDGIVNTDLVGSR